MDWKTAYYLINNVKIIRLGDDAHILIIDVVKYLIVKNHIIVVKISPSQGEETIYLDKNWQRAGIARWRNYFLNADLKKIRKMVECGKYNVISLNG